MELSSRIYIAGHTGLIGSALEQELLEQGFTNILTRTRGELDLANQDGVRKFFNDEEPEYVFLCAARVGGKKANRDFPAEFIRENLEIQTNIIHNSFRNRVKKLVFLGSNCMYPKEAPQPYKEVSLMTGKIEETNEPYGMAKAAGAVMCKSYNFQYGTNFICAIPASQFGPKDNFSGKEGHLVPDLIRKFHEVKLKELAFLQMIGTGEGRREIMYSKDTANALVFLMENYNSNEPINIGVGVDYSIKEIADAVAGVVGFKGIVEYEKGAKTGITRKILDSSKINNLGWHSKSSLEEGLRNTYNWFVENYDRIKNI